MSRVHWLTDINGSFTNPSDWSGGQVPGASDDAILDAVGSAFTVTSGVDETVHNVQLASNATLSLTAGTFVAKRGTGSGENAGVILIGAGATLVSGGTLTNTGTIALYSGRAGAASLLFDSKSTTLSGGGEILLEGRKGDTLGAIGHREALVYNIDNTIVGSGTIANRLFLGNEKAGTIDANGSAPLVIREGIANYGLIEATGSGGITVTGRKHGEIGQSTTGVVLVGDGSSVRLNNTTLQGGTLESAGSGTFVLNSTYIAGFEKDILTIDANLEILGSCYFNGPIVNNGTISASNGRINVIGSLTLTGDGVIDLDGDGLQGGGGTVTLVGGAISGPGGVLVGQLTIGAAGVIDNGGATVLDLAVYQSASIVNAGTIKSAGAGGILAKDAIANSGTLSVTGGGTLEAEGAVSGKGVAIINGGTLDVLATFNEAVTFTGGGSLDLAKSQGFTNTVTGFSDQGATTLDLGDIHFVGPGEATFSGTATSGVLTVTDGTHTAHITLDGNYLDTIFVASSDGQSGTDVVAQSAMSPAGAIHAFVAVMAGLGPPAAGAVQGREPWSPHTPFLSAPRTMIA